jgi:hypothetical protein
MFDSEVHKKKVILLSRLRKEGVITLEESLLLLNEEDVERQQKRSVSSNEDLQRLLRYNPTTATGQWTYPYNDSGIYTNGTNHYSNINTTSTL